MEYPPPGGYSVFMSKITIHIVPNASTSQVIGKQGIAWKIRITASPIEGRANDALIKFLSDILDISKSSITITSGHTSKVKILEIPLPLGYIEDLLQQAI